MWRSKKILKMCFIYLQCLVIYKISSISAKDCSFIMLLLIYTPILIECSYIYINYEDSNNYEILASFKQNITKKLLISACTLIFLIFLNIFKYTCYPYLNILIYEILSFTWIFENQFKKINYLIRKGKK